MAAILNSTLQLLDRNGATVQDLGRIRNQVDGGFAYSTSDDAIFMLQLQHRRIELIEISARTGRKVNVAPAFAFALSPDGRRVAYVTEDGRGVGVKTLASDQASTWRPGHSLPSSEYLYGGVAWLNSSSVLIEPEPAATRTSARSPSSRSSSSPWYVVRIRNAGIHGRPVHRPNLPDPQPVLSHDAAPPSGVYAISRERTTTIDRLEVSGNRLRVHIAARVRVTLGMAVSPRGRRLIYVERHVKQGNQYTDMDVCRLHRNRATQSRVLRHHLGVDQVAWAT